MTAAANSTAPPSAASLPYDKDRASLTAVGYRIAIFGNTSVAKMTLDVASIVLETVVK